MSLDGGFRQISVGGEAVSVKLWWSAGVWLGKPNAIVLILCIDLVATFINFLSREIEELGERMVKLVSLDHVLGVAIT